MNSRTITLSAALATLVGTSARADEGMWLFNDFPSKKLEKQYGFGPDQAWLDHVRLSSARLAQGCSASFVSPNGLVMTNHHCVHGCVEQLSTSKKNFVERGFQARKQSQEKQCPAMELNQLIEISDVTARIQKATANKSGAEYFDARKAEMSKIEKGCASSAEIRCDVVTLYNGGRFNLYKYRRFQDVRLVFAPEVAIAFFGGDPDNFNFPRYNLDVGFLRVYQNGQPAKTEHYLKWSDQGAQDGELVFVSGHPGSTRRLLTIAELEYIRDTFLPERLIQFSELRGMLTELSRHGSEQARIAKTPLFYVENAVKAFKGRREALVDPSFFAKLRASEHALRSKVEADAQLKKKYGGAWSAIEKAQARQLEIRSQVNFKELHRGFGSRLLRIAIGLVRNAEESKKPNEKRLREYTDGRMPELQAELFTPAPIYPELEMAMMRFWLTKLREELGPDDPFVKLVLGSASPDARATQLVRGSRLRDIKTRKALFDGGAAAIARSKDPMVQLAIAMDPASRATRKTYEDEVESIVEKNSELIAQARFAVEGTSNHPDATFSLRLSYGTVQGFPHRGKMVPPFTQLKGLYERATGQDPFKLPQSWLRSKSKLDLSTPMDLVTTNDIIGGNSGSPLINARGEVVGLIFDGNIYSLGGDYGFDSSTNRAVSVHSQAIIEALDKVYDARALLEELGR